jgi:hypothetical protein
MLSKSRQGPAGPSAPLFSGAECRKERFPERVPLVHTKCRIPDDSIQNSRWPLFFSREILQKVVDSLKARKGGEDETSFA